MRSPFRARKLQVQVAFGIAVSLAPLWSFVGGFVSRPDARGMADGPEGRWYWPLAFAFMLAGLLGCAATPLWYPQNLERKIIFTILGIFAFMAAWVLGMMMVGSIWQFVD